jgi:predicted esterase
VRLIHGDADDVVPVEAYTHARDTLTRAGFAVSGHTTPYLTHSIDEEGINSGAAFLRDIFK